MDEKHKLKRSKKLEKKILIIDGHPFGKGFSSELAKAYHEEASTSFKSTKIFKISGLNKNIFECRFENNNKECPFEALRQDISWANHIVITYPTWWGGPPAFLKAVFDFLFTPGWAFKYIKKQSLRRKKLLKGKTARIITTMDMKPLVYRLKYSSPGVNLIKRTIFNFCGIKPVKISIFGSVRKASEHDKEKWKRRIRSLGKKGR